MLQIQSFGFGAALLATFLDGRLEEYLPCTTVTPEGMRSPSLAQAIARQLARWHTMEIEVPELQREAQTFRTIRKWLDLSRSLSFPDPGKQEAHAAIDWQALRARVDDVEALCRRVRSPTVFCHNDLLSGNILQLQLGDESPKEKARDVKDLTFIDFEYGAYGHRGFDIGNHWNEYAGFECDYSRYPSEEEKRTFVRGYLEELSISGYDHVEDDERREELTTDLIVEADTYALASHLFWAVWAIIQARYSSIDFDFLDYFYLRYGEVLRRLPTVQGCVNAWEATRKEKQKEGEGM